MSLFGVDIAQNVFDGLTGKLKTGTLQRTTEEYDPVQGTEVETSTDYDFEGFVDQYSKKLVAEGIVQQNDRKILILAKSLDVVPSNGGTNQQADVIEIEGESFTVVGVPERDPAGATYIVQGRL